MIALWPAPSWSAKGLLSSGSPDGQYKILIITSADLLGCDLLTSKLDINA